MVNPVVPVMAGAARGARYAKPYLDDALRMIKKWLNSSPGAAKTAARRIGLPDNTSVGGIVKSVKDNPVTTALVLAEMGSAGQDLLEGLASESEVVREQITQMGLLDDKVTPETRITDIGEFKEEFAAIRNVAGRVGGIEQLKDLRRVLNMDDSLLALYEEVQDLRRF